MVRAAHVCHLLGCLSLVAPAGIVRSEMSVRHKVANVD